MQEAQPGKVSLIGSMLRFPFVACKAIKQSLQVGADTSSNDAITARTAVTRSALSWATRRSMSFVEEVWRQQEPGSCAVKVGDGGRKRS
jgi:hypothetical protein